MKQLPIYQIDTFEAKKEDALFYANGFKEHLADHGFINKAHGHNFYLTVLFTSGFGIHEIDFEKYTITPGSIFTLKPGQVHHWKFSKNINGYIFFHSNDFFELLYNQGGILSRPEFFLNRKTPTISLNKKKLALIEQMFHNLTIEYKNADIFKAEKTCALAFLIYLELTRIDTNQPEDTGLNIHYLNKIRKLESLINDNFVTLKLPRDYADLMNITPKHLNRISKYTLGITVTQLIIQRIVLEGKRLLINPKYSIEQIAEKLGYNDPSYFTKVFKKSTGIAPNSFRNT
jgi:AraC-like DNA-binding protein